MGKLSDKIRAVRCPRVSAVVVAAGSGTRFGGDKLRADLDGAPVLVHSLRVFDRAELVDEIVLVARPDALEDTAALCGAYGIAKLSCVVPGGETRADSCLAGVMAASDKAEIIAIHDGARPLVTEEIVNAAVWSAHLHSAAVPAIPVRDTIKRAEGRVVTETPDRSTLFAVQTPQCFQRDVIRGALYDAVQSGVSVTDDCMAVERIGGQIWLMDGSEENIKITTPLDLALAELIIQRRKNA